MVPRETPKSSQIWSRERLAGEVLEGWIAEVTLGSREYESFGIAWVETGPPRVIPDNIKETGVGLIWG